MFVKMKWQVYVISILSPLVLLSFFYWGIVDGKINAEKMKLERQYRLQLDSLMEDIEKMEQENEQLREIQFYVTATMYHPTKQQCDSTPNITADGTRINVWKAGDYKFIAMSRDLLHHFSYGDYVLIENAGKYNGIYQVRDTMNSRWRNRIDFLCSIGTEPFRFENVRVRKM